MSAVNDIPRSSARPSDDMEAKLCAADAALRLSADRIEAILQGIGDGIVVADEWGTLELFNRAAEELLGIGLASVPLENWSDTSRVFMADGVTPYPPEKLPLARAIRGERVHDEELVIRNPARTEPVPILARAMPIRNRDGELKGGVVVFHDITERKRHEQAIIESKNELEALVEERTAELRASEARYHDLYDNAPDMFASFDASTRSLLRCNQTFLTATGFAKKEVIGRATFELFDAECLPAVRDAFRTFIETGSVRDVELKLLRKDGSTMDVSLNVSAVRARDGCVLYGRSVMRDITQHKQAEKQIMEQQAELAHFARLSTMGEMAAGLAHEINQPLAAIAAYAEGASLRLKNGAAAFEDLIKIIERIAADAHRAGEVIRRLRQFVRKREIDRAPVDANELVREVCQFLRSEAKQREILVQLRLSRRVPNVDADAVGIEQVILNLLRNAFDALAEVQPERRRVVLRTGFAQGMVEVTVEDAGPGIPPELADRIFEPFFTSKTSGLGMGLAISRSIIESHGGRIWTGSSKLGGASVHFSLPIPKRDSDL